MGDIVVDEDSRQLELLSIFHYIVAGILALCGMFPIIHLLVGIGLVSGAFADSGDQGPPPAWIGVFFIIVALTAMIISWSLAVAVCLAASRLKRRAGYNYCLVVAGIECVFMPFGTVLGVLTIVVLMRPTVKTLFAVPSLSSASS
jgi:hypothetical protein